MSISFSPPGQGDAGPINKGNPWIWSGWASRDTYLKTTSKPDSDISKVLAMAKDQLAYIIICGDKRYDLVHYPEANQVTFEKIVIATWGDSKKCQEDHLKKDLLNVPLDPPGICAHEVSTKLNFLDLHYVSNHKQDDTSSCTTTMGPHQGL